MKYEMNPCRLVGNNYEKCEEIAQAIPPVFAEYLARQIWGALTAANT